MTHDIHTDLSNLKVMSKLQLQAEHPVSIYILEEQQKLDKDHLLQN